MPLKRIWMNECGYPLYAASYFWPESRTYQWQMVQHKRAIGGAWSAGSGKSHTLTINRQAGPHKEKRIPVPAETSVTGRYTAYCIGNADEIARLLATCTQFSGRRSIGLGEVELWEIEPVPELTLSMILVTPDNRLSRAIPAGAVSLLPRMPAEPPAAMVGWTPPQWKPTLFSPGWRAGTPVQAIDWYAAAP